MNWVAITHGVRQSPRQPGTLPLEILYDDFLGGRFHHVLTDQIDGRIFARIYVGTEPCLGQSIGKCVRIGFGLVYLRGGLGEIYGSHVVFSRFCMEFCDLPP
jgi:hypothetical protein